MTIRRAPRTGGYTVLNNVVFTSGLSFQAMGLLAYLLSKPDHWQVSVTQLAAVCKDRRGNGRDAVYNILRELVAARFVERVQVRNEIGQMEAHEYLVLDDPLPASPQVAETTQVITEGEAKTEDTPRQLKKQPEHFQAIVNAFHELLPMLPRVVLMPAARKRALERWWRWILTSTKTDGTRRAETAEGGLAWVRGYFQHAAKSDFITGRAPRSNGHQNWQADIDFLISDRGMKIVIEKTREQEAS